MCLEKFGKLAATLAVNQQESVANKALANVRTLVVGEGHVGVCANPNYKQGRSRRCRCQP